MNMVAALAGNAVPPPQPPPLPLLPQPPPNAVGGGLPLPNLVRPESVSPFVPITQRSTPLDTSPLSHKSPLAVNMYLDQQPQQPDANNAADVHNVAAAAAVNAESN